MHVHLRAEILAEDMGPEEVRKVQALKFQGGKAPSTFVPTIVPIIKGLSLTAPFEKNSITPMGVTICMTVPGRILLDAV